MDGRTRSGLLDDIRVVAAECGFAATVKAMETVIDAGRTIDRTAIATCARRVLEGKGSSGGQDLKHYDKYMGGRAWAHMTASRASAAAEWSPRPHPDRS